MDNWYFLSIIALFFMGTQRFLYKVSAERGCNTAWTTFVFMTTVTGLSLLFLIFLNKPLGKLDTLLLFAFLNSISFVVGTMMHMEALKYLPSSVVYTIIRMNVVIVILFSTHYFNDRFSPFQIAGILTALGVILILTRHLDDRDPSHRAKKRGLLLVSISLFCGSIASISGKFAALYTNRMAFMGLSYMIGAIFSFTLTRTQKKGREPQKLKESVIIGLIMGLINFVGFYTFLKALSLGPLSIIVSITSLHFVIAIVLSSLIYKERFNRLRIAGVLLAVLSVILLRM
jgi:drug/metabolite transporter (DMT)-like permease